MSDNLLKIYNSLMFLTRKKNLYIENNIKDTFSNRLILFFFHFAFFLKIYKNHNKQLIQKIYDFIFRQIELSLREIGYGDVSINKKMKDYINIFYSILDKINDWNNLDNVKKGEILGFYYKLKDNHLKIVNYFNNFEIYLSKTSLKSFTKSVINHKF